MRNIMFSSREITDTILKPVKEIPRAVRRRFRASEAFHGWLAKGFEHSGGDALTLVYAGVERHKNYFFQMAFREGYEETVLNGKTPQAMIHEVTREFPSCDALFMELKSQKEERAAFKEMEMPHFKIPLWVRFELHLPGTLDDFKKNKNLINLRRSWAKNEFDYVFVNDEEMFNRFYDEIYVPFTRHKHGACAFVHTREEAKMKFKTGELLVVKDHDELIGGVILEYTPTSCIPACIGVRESKMHLLRDSFVSAILYRGILRAKERSFERVDLGYTHAFLKDGHFLFKYRLGAELQPDYHESSGYIMMRSFKLSLALKDFLAANPFLTLDSAGGYRAVLFGSYPGDINQNLIDEKLNDLSINVQNIDLYDFNRDEGVREISWDSHPQAKIRIYAANELT